MKKLLVIALLFIATAAISAVLPTALAAQTVTPTDKCTTEITLKCVTADFILRALGVNGNGVPVQNTDPTSSGTIDSIVASQSGNALVITGTQSAVKDMEVTIGRMDVEPRNVLVKLDYYEVDSKFAETADQINEAYSKSFGPSSSPTSELVRGLESELKAAGARPIATPVLSALTFLQSEVSNEFCIPSAQNGKPIVYSAKSAVTPRINDDGTITLALSVSISHSQWDASANSYTQRSQSIYTQRRRLPGEPMLVGKFDTQPGKILLIIANASLPSASASSAECVPFKIEALPESLIQLYISADCLLMDSDRAAKLLPGGPGAAANLTHSELIALWKGMGVTESSLPNKPVTVGQKNEIIADTWIPNENGAEQVKNVEAKLSVTPVINKDDTITLDVTASVHGKAAGGAVCSISAVRKVSSSERILLGVCEYAPGKSALIFVNAAVLKWFFWTDTKLDPPAINRHPIYLN